MSKSKKLVMVKGLDRGNKEFTAFVLCDEEQNKKIQEAKSGKGSFDLSELNVIHVMEGHYLDYQIQNDISEYYQYLVGDSLN